MICCDTCPLSPTCEEESDFLRRIFGCDDEPGEDSELGTCGVCDTLHARCSRQDWHA